MVFVNSMMLVHQSDSMDLLNLLELLAGVNSNSPLFRYFGNTGRRKS